jgi:hypothetical protein
MSESLKQRIQADMKSALRAREQQRLGTIRLLQAAIKQREIDERIVLNDEQIIAILGKMIKQRRDSITQYEHANRQDLADKEAFEIEVLQTYLPQPLSEAELIHLIEAKIAESHATSPKDLGKVMRLIKPCIQGRADMKIVSDQVKSYLNQS